VFIYSSGAQHSHLLEAESANSTSDSDLYIQPHSPQSMYVAHECFFHTVTVRAESVDGSTPGARVTWSTTIPPECVASVTVEFRNGSNGSVVSSYTTTNTSETEVIETGLQCDTTYNIGVTVTGVGLLDNDALTSNEVDVPVGGEVNTCVASSSTIEICA